MKIGRRGKDLAVRIPARLVRELELRLGDEVQLARADEGTLLLAKVNARPSSDA